MEIMVKSWALIYWSCISKITLYNIILFELASGFDHDTVCLTFPVPGRRVSTPFWLDTCM